MASALKFTRAQAVTSFLSKLSIHGPDACWLWTGAVYNHGYGVFVWRGKLHGANRVAWEIAHGVDVPAGMHVLHSCDVPLCCNPSHLWIGTHKQNMDDMHKKGRAKIGLLTPEQVREIRSLFPQMMQKEIASKFKISAGVVSKLALGKTYQYVK